MKYAKQYLRLVTFLVVVTLATHVLLGPHGGTAWTVERRSLWVRILTYANSIAGVCGLLIAPWAMAVAEHTLDRNIFYGDCRVRNIPPGGNGYVAVGTVRLPEGRKAYHVQAMTENFLVYDVACPGCVMDEYDFALQISDYSVVWGDFRKHSLKSVEAYVYLRTALWVRKAREIL